MRIDSNNNGFLDLILFILIFLFLLVVVCGPFLIYREISIKQRFIKDNYGIEMTKGDIFLINPKIVFGEHGVRLEKE